MKFAPFLLLACLAGGILGCGKKGPLMLPDAQKHKRTVFREPGQRRNHQAKIETPARGASVWCYPVEKEGSPNR